jgi:hypothetical protein
MPARSPDEICHLFKRYMAMGDIEALLTIYDPDAVFLSQSREISRGRDAGTDSTGCGEGSVRVQHPTDHSDGGHRTDAHPMEPSLT